MRPSFAPRHRAEADFVEQLLKTPSANELRAVYADWLESVGDVASAESLRVDALLSAAPSAHETGPLARRLVELRDHTSEAWRAVALRWSTVADVVLLPLAEARQVLQASSHPRAAVVAETVTEWVEAMGVGSPDDPYGLVRVFRKNLVVPGDFYVSMSATVVLGDLAIERQYTDLIDADQSLLAVAGDLRCGAIWELGELFVAGNVRCATTFYGSSHFTTRAEVLGDVTTEVLVENGHFFVIHGRLEARARVGSRLTVGGQAPTTPDDLERLDSALLTDGELDEDAVYQRVVEGRSLLP